jgi:Rrf2 family protein
MGGYTETMRLTTKSQYGLRVLGDLVRNWRTGGNVYMQVGDLASRCDTSQKYLEQVLLPLSHAGILESKRGQRGGYRLNRAPEDISLAEALRHLEGLLMPIPKWADDGTADTSQLGSVLRRVRDSIRSILEHTSIEVLAESGEENKQRADEAVEALMYYI